MANLKERIQNLTRLKSGFSPHYKKDDNLNILTFIHSITAFIIFPVFSLVIYLFGIPDVYFYLSISYTLLFPVYLFFCWKINYLNNKLNLFFVGHFFVMTFLAFISLIENNIKPDELFMFSGLFVIGVLVIQRVYLLLLYISFVILLFLYLFSTITEVGEFSYVIFVILFIISICAFFVLLIRARKIKSIENYSGYLQQIINTSGFGYILFDVKKDNRIIDFNSEVSKLFNIKNITKTEVELIIFKNISSRERKIITELSEGKTFTKQVKINYLNIPQIIEFKINIFKIKKDKLWLLQIKNVTSDLDKIETIRQSEKKYRNLYENNKAGFFTIDKNSIILDGNQAFFKMLDSLCSIGDRLFIKESEKDWELILESLGENEHTQNYQTQFKLSNGNEKTFVFNWYLDNKTNNIEGSVIDLSKIQKASLALKQSEEKYRLIYEETNDAILILDDDKIIDSNKKTKQLFGLSQQALLEMTLYDLTYEKEDKKLTEYNSKKKSQNSRSVKFDWVFNGGGKKIEAQVVVIEVTLGDKMYYQCVIHDNTSNNEHIRSIEKSQQNLTNILENHPEGIIISKNKSILFTNAEITKLIGKNVDLDALFNKKDQEKFNTIYKEHLTSRERINEKLNIINLTKNKILMDVTLAPTIFEEEEAVLLILKDVSHQNKIEREKLRAEVAEESNKKLENEIKERISAEKKLEEQFLRMKAIFDSSSNTFLLTLDLDGNISSFNKHSKEYFEKVIKKELKKNKPIHTYFNSIVDDEKIEFFRKTLNKVKQGKPKQFELDIDYKTKKYWLDVFISPIYDTEGEVSEISLVAHDISEKKKTAIEIEGSLKEKEVLLKEIHHRVKNNLQVISSILNLQSSFIDDEKTLAILQESRNRVRTMAIIHENLYRTEDFSSINFSNYIDNLTGNLISSYKINEEINLVKNLNEVELVLDQAIPCGLIVNEIISNSLKYAWEQNEKGSIFISLREEKNVVYLEISDDGVGLPFDFNSAITDTLGLQLVSTLVEQLDGEIFVDSDKGTKYLIKFDKIKT